MCGTGSTSVWAVCKTGSSPTARPVEHRKALHLDPKCMSFTLNEASGPWLLAVLRIPRSPGDPAVDHRQPCTPGHTPTDSPDTDLEFAAVWGGARPTHVYTRASGRGRGMKTALFHSVNSQSSPSTPVQVARVQPPQSGAWLTWLFDDACVNTASLFPLQSRSRSLFIMPSQRSVTTSPSLEQYSPHEQSSAGLSANRNPATPLGVSQHLRPAVDGHRALS